MAAPVQTTSLVEVDPEVQVRACSTPAANRRPVV